MKKNDTESASKRYLRLIKIERQLYDMGRELQQLGVRGVKPALDSLRKSVMEHTVPLQDQAYEHLNRTLAKPIAAPSRRAKTSRDH
jgi:hypothetical protein